MYIHTHYVTYGYKIEISQNLPEINNKIDSIEVTQKGNEGFLEGKGSENRRFSEGKGSENRRFSDKIERIKGHKAP
jgi:hypothetical protein